MIAFKAHKLALMLKKIPQKGVRAAVNPITFPFARAI